MMAKPVKRILVTNDDGIDAPGLKTALKIALSLSDDVWVVAPAREQSGASHSLTLTAPVRLIKREARRFAVEGTPTDCVMVATRQLMCDAPPSLILSGVNFGFNIAEDVSYSGTVAGAKEGTVFGIPSIAMSQAMTMSFESGIMRRIEHFEVAEKYGADIVGALVRSGWPSDTLMNINFPAISLDAACRVRITHQGKRDAGFLKLDARLDPRGQPYFWYDFDRKFAKKMNGIDENSDIYAVFNGDISVTPLKMDHTDAVTSSHLRTLFDDRDKVGQVSSKNVRKGERNKEG